MSVLTDFSVSGPTSLAPTRLRLPDLLHATDRCADDVLSGRYDRLLPADGLPLDAVGYMAGPGAVLALRAPVRANLGLIRLEGAKAARRTAELVAA